MPESFVYRGRVYLLSALLLIFGALVYSLFLIERARQSSISPGEITVGALCLLLLVIVIATAWSTSTVTVNEDVVARIMLGRKLQELCWSELGKIKLIVLPGFAGSKATRLIAVRPKSGRLGIGMSDSVMGFERFASVVTKITQRHNIEMEESDAYRKLSPP